MIVFDLVCVHGHRFEGWFASGEAFAEQSERKLVRCPVCDEAHVERLPSARVNARAGKAANQAPKKAEAVAGMPSEMVAKLREIVKNTEDVGERFPEEARKIHYDETPKRSIRGKASKEDAEALQEEGIEFQALPPFLTGESH